MRRYKKVFLLVGLGAWLPLLWTCNSQEAEDPQAASWTLHYQTGISAFQQGRHAEAEKSWRLALDDAGAFPEQDSRLHRTLDQLAHLYVVQGQTTRAESLYQRLLAIQEDHLGPDDPRTAATLGKLADVYRAQDQFHQAESLYQRLLAIQEKGLEARDPGIAATLGKLADVYRAQDQFHRADSLSKRAMALKLRGQGYAHFVRGRNRPAERFYRRALAIQEKNLGAAHPDLARILDQLASILKKAGRRKEAIAAAGRARSIRAQPSSSQD